MFACDTEHSGGATEQGASSAHFHVLKHETARCRIAAKQYERCAYFIFFYVTFCLTGYQSEKNKLCQFLKGKYLEEYMVLNMKTGNGKVGRIEN